MQVGIVTKNVHWNLGLARTQDGPQLYQSEGCTSLQNKADFGVTRDSATTSYELRLPLADLGLAPGMEFGMNIVFLDDDKGSGPRYRLQLAPGLDGFERTTSPEKVYPRFVLPK